MSEAPLEWFRALAVDEEAVARVGYGLAAYAADHETPKADRREATFEDRLLAATTLTEAATLLALVDSTTAAEQMAHAATLFEEARAPEAWVVGMAAGRRWEPRLNQLDVSAIGRPSDAMSSLAGVYSRHRIRLEGEQSGWDAAVRFTDNPSTGWSALRVPAGLFSQVAISIGRGSTADVLAALNRIIERSDETVRLVQERDAWRWRNFVSAVPLLDPELLALGSLIAHTDLDMVRLAEYNLSPARVAVLAGMRMGGGFPPFEITE